MLTALASAMLVTGAAAQHTARAIPLSANDPMTRAARQFAFPMTNVMGNQPPVAVADTFTLEAVTPFAFNQSNWLPHRLRPIDDDYDPEGDAISLVSVGTPALGSVSGVTTSAFRYYPPVGYVGSDSMSYTIRDSVGNQAVGSIGINMVPSRDTAEQVQRLFFGRSNAAINRFTDTEVMPDGTVYVCGYTREFGGGTVPGVVVYKFGPTGNLLLGAGFVTGFGKSDMQMTKLAVVGDQVYLSGQGYDSTYLWDTMMIQFDVPNGLGWFHIHNNFGDDFTNDLKVDSQGNAIVGCFTAISGARLIKYGIDHSEQWITDIQSLYGTGAFNQISIAPDDSIMGAGFHGNATNDSMAACVNADGSVRWKVITDEKKLGGDDFMNDVAVDTDGNPVMVGYTTSGGPIVRKLASGDGSIVWNRNLNMTGLSMAYASFAVSTPNGVAVAGDQLSSSSGMWTSFIEEFAPDGTRLFLTPFAPADPSNIQNHFCSDLATDGWGGLYVAGAGYDATFSSGASHAFSFDKNGVQRWSRYKVGNKLESSQGYAISVNASGRVSTSGTFQNGAWEEGLVSVYDQTPVLYNDSYNVGEMQTLTVSGSGVLGNDAIVLDGAAVLVSGPAKGTLALAADGSFTYTAAKFGFGDQTFTYAVQRPGLPLSAPATVKLNVTQVLDKPTPVKDNAQTWAGIPVTIDVIANDTDPNSLPLTLVGSDPGAQGTTAIVGGQVVYTPSNSATVTDTFTYTVSNGSVTAIGTVTVKILPDPSITALNPAKINVGSTGVLVRVLGKNFGTVPGAVAMWNGSPRTTTWVSATEVQFTALDGDLLAEGSASITVANAAGRVSSAYAMPIVGKPLFSATARRIPSTNTVEITVTNIGTGTGTNLVLTGATLKTTIPAIGLPLPIATSVAPGASAQIVVSYPAGTFTPKPGNIAVKFTYDGGTYTKTIVLN